MSSATNGEKSSRILEDPNAVKHMDALFDVVNIHSCGKSKKKKTRDDRDWRAAVSGVDPAMDDVDLLDALFAVVQSEPGAGGHRKHGTTKSWKERELPPSFFNAGPEKSTELNSEASETQRSRETPCCAGRGGSSSPPLAAQSTESTVVTTAAPATAVLVADTPECLTFYIE